MQATFAAILQTHRGEIMRALYIAGWTANVVGLILWFYGYFATGSASIIDWPSISPEWISSFMPNLEAEMGVLVMCLGMLPFLELKPGSDG